MAGTGLGGAAGAVGAELARSLSRQFAQECAWKGTDQMYTEAGNPGQKVLTSAYGPPFRQAALLMGPRFDQEPNPVALVDQFRGVAGERADSAISGTRIIIMRAIVLLMEYWVICHALNVLAEILDRSSVGKGGKKGGGGKGGDGDGGGGGGD